MKKPANPRTIVTKTSRRDVLIAVACGLALFGFVLLAIVALRSHHARPSPNRLSGTIVEKYHAGEREKEITFGRKGLKSRETDSGHRFLIRVESEGRTYEVPVPQTLYDSRNVGDKQDFIRPRSEQE